MATAAQLKSLLRSYSEADGERFLSVATQIAAHAARSGKSKLAAELKQLLGEIKERQAATRIGGAVPIALPQGELATVLAVSYPQTRLSEMVLGEAQRECIDRVLTEYRQQSKLRDHGLSARRKLLLVGPPGCGKTMTSRAIAGELRLPHFAVQLHALITKFMGETAAKLHAVFGAMSETRGVYLFDEFDAIGGERTNANDVGEIRRVLNSFLQFLEQDDSDSLIVAATNNVGVLDDALFRRFDDVVVYELPAAAEIRELVTNRLSPFKLPKLDWEEVVAYAGSLSHAEIGQACDDAAKDAVLADLRAIDPNALYRALRSKQKLRQSN